MTAAGIEACRLLLRLGIGLIFVFSGIEKLLPGTAATVAYFASLGIPSPEVTGPAIGFLELGGGMLLIVGLATRLMSALFISEMTVAVLVARLPIAVEADSLVGAVAAIRLEVLIIVVAVCLLLLGGGRWTMDSVAGGVRARLRPRDEETQSGA